MWSSSRKHARLRATLALAAVPLWALLASHRAQAQEIAFVPQASVTGEYATNRILSTPAAPNSADVQVSAGADIKANTQVASFDLRPLVTYMDDTKIKNLDQYQALVDLVSAYRTQKSEWNLEAEYQRQDAFNAEYGLVDFNPLNPNAPNTQGTGFIVTGDTKTSFDVEPSFSYDLTQRWSLSGNLAYDAARYSTDVPGYLVSFNSEQAEVDMGYALSRESTLGAGPYYTNYEPTNDNEDAVRDHGYGLNVNYNYKLSQVTSTKVTVRVERDTTAAGYGFPETSLTTWSAEWTGTHKFLTSTVQFSLGRFLEPSSFGGRTSVDQVRVQYARLFTQRLNGNIAVRLTRNTDIGDVANEESGNRDRAQVQLTLGYFITEQLSVSGGYRYAYQSLPVFDTTVTGAVISAGQDHAHSNAVFLTVAYHGRDATRQ
jgi:hypothetical protein